MARRRLPKTQAEAALIEASELMALGSPWKTLGHVGICEFGTGE
jgi:hypothetical protein